MKILQPSSPILPRRFAAMLAVAVLTAGAAVRVHSATVTTDKTNYVAGDDITVTFAGPGNAKDWLGIYPEGATPGSATPSTLWYYVDGTQNGTTAISSGSVNFAGGLATAGRWMVTLLENDGYTVLATASFEVKAKQPVGPVPMVMTDHSAYYPGEDIQITFGNGPGNRLDWVGIYPDGIVPGSVGSTRWYYVGGSQTASVGLKEGSVAFPGGLNLANDWKAYLLLNDEYTILAETKFAVVDPSTPLVRADLRNYLPNQPITASFMNGPGNPKDWIGIYKKDQIPGSATPSTLWYYTDKTKTGATGVATGSVVFTNGLAATGEYVILFLLNDGYTPLASESFTVSVPITTPRVLSVAPASGSSNNPAAVAFGASITNGSTKVALSSIKLTLDGATVTPSTNQVAELVLVSFTNTVLFAPKSSHTFVLTFNDTGATKFTNTVTFTVADYRNIVLPAPLFFEDFDSTPEGQLPNGWTQTNYTDILNPDVDLGNLDSATFATWTVVAADRFNGSFVAYSDPNGPPAYQTDYHRVLSVNPLNVLNGKVVNEPLAKGRFVFADSGYRQGAAQVMYLFSPDFNLTGKSNVHVSYASLWEQNQDSFASLEYSIDTGMTWLPVVYMLDGPDVLRDAEGNIDVVATFTTDHGDAAHYTDPVTGEQKGGFYGSFIGAEVGTNLIPAISIRVNDDPVESKRIELFRLPQADNQAKVRFRFAHAGTDSWYWGVDNFGLYSIGAETPSLKITKTGNDLTISWDAAGFVLESTDKLNPAAWSAVTGVSGNSFTTTAGGTAKFYRLRQ